MIATNPWSHHVVADEIPVEKGGNATMMYHNYWGYEIDMLQTVSKALNFDYTIVNPPDGLWGNIKSDGTWSGLVWEAARGAVDFVMSDVFISFPRSQVIDGTILFDKDYQVMLLFSLIVFGINNCISIDLCCSSAPPTAQIPLPGESFHRICLAVPLYFCASCFPYHVGNRKC